MRRDPQLIRMLMLDLELATSTVTNSNIKIDGYTDDEIKYHLNQIIDAGFAVGNVIHGQMGAVVPAVVVISRLTSAGHDFIDSTREDTVWNAVTTKVTETGGGFTLDLLRQLALKVLLAHVGL